MAEAGFDLGQFLPKKDLGAKVEIRKELAPVVERISKIIPPDLLWSIFASHPNETGGTIVFPYFRLDSSLLVSRQIVADLGKNGKEYSLEEYRKLYMEACRESFGALLWIETGFQGLENLATSPASRNLGWFSNAEERAKGIMSGGKKLFDECLRKFVAFRDKAGITDDYFSQYGVEYLLDKFR